MLSLSLLVEKKSWSARFSHFKFGKLVILLAFLLGNSVISASAKSIASPRASVNGKKILAHTESANSTFVTGNAAQVQSTDLSVVDLEEAESTAETDEDSAPLNSKVFLPGGKFSGKRRTTCTEYTTDSSLPTAAWRSFRRAPYGASPNADARWNPLPSAAGGFELAVCRKDKPKSCNPLVLSDYALAKRYKKSRVYLEPSALGLDEVFCPTNKSCRARLRVLTEDCKASEWTYSEVVEKPAKLIPPYIQYIGRPTYYDCYYDVYDNLICGYYYVNDTVSLGWSYVPGAVSYLLAVCGTTASASYCSYSGLSVEELDRRYSTYSLRTRNNEADVVCSNSHNCVVRVKAEAGSASNYVDSDWSYSATIGNVD